MVYKKSAKISGLIKECRMEMKNDLYFLHSALEEIQVKNKNLSINATKSASSSYQSIKKQKYIGGALLSSTMSDQLTESNFETKKRKLYASEPDVKGRKMRLNKRKRISEKKSFTYKHYDLYLVTKTSVESCRNNCEISSLLLKKNVEELSLEKSYIKNIQDTSVNNQTIFEPKFSSSPIRREQKTSTPTKMNPCRTEKPKISINNASRLKFLNTTNLQTSANTTRHTNQPNAHSFEYQQNTSTPKVVRRNNVRSGTTYAFKICNDSGKGIIESFCAKNSSAPSTVSTSNVSTVIKCCMQPLKRFIFYKNLKKSPKHREF